MWQAGSPRTPGRKYQTRSTFRDNSPFTNASSSKPGEQQQSGRDAKAGTVQTSHQPTDQDVQMGDAPIPLPSLHHSADNHEPSAQDISLKYPSGGIEFFSFGKRTHKNFHRYARPLAPIDDIIRTIEVFCIQHGSHTKAELDIMRDIIHTAFQNRDKLSSISPFSSFQELINSFIPSPSPSPSLSTHYLQPDLTTHFITQLHDRIIAPDAHLLSRPSSAPLETTYGELLPPFLSTLFLQTALTPSSSSSKVYVDLGSGIGQTCMQAALETSCTAFGIERSGRTAALAALHLQQFAARAELWGLQPGDVVLRKGDFLKCAAVEIWLGKADVVLVNNLKLEPETDEALAGKLEKEVRSGCRVVSTRPLVMIEREGRKRKRNLVVVQVRESARKRRKGVSGLLTPPPERRAVGEEQRLVERSGENGVWMWRQYVYPAGSVSWSDKPGVYYISVRK